MFLSVLLKSFSQIAQKTSRRKPVGAFAVLAEHCEERTLLSATSSIIGSAIPKAPIGGSFAAAPSGTPVPLTNLPILNSRPGAPVSVILKVDGYTDNDPGWIAFRDSGSGPIVTPAFDLDDDPTTFSPEELRQIEEIWYRVAEDFAPLDINVTTVAPPVLNDFEHVMVVIGGDGDWAPPAGGWGIYGFNGPAANTNYVFSELFFNAHQIASASTHESGHTFGLSHQSTYDSNGTRINEYNPGDANSAPIMGSGYSTMRDTWWFGPNSTSSTTIQDDLALLTASRNQTVRYRTDDHGNSITTASALAATSANVSASGVIERNDDSDFFQFTTDTGPISFTVEGLNLRRIYSDNSLTFGTNLDAVLRLYDAAGALVSESNPGNSLSATLSANVTAGIYYVEVTKTAQYGAIGQYNLTGTVNPLETFSLTVNQSSVFENAGVNAAVGTVSRSDFANLSSPVTVTLTSSDTSELTVPGTVIIPAGLRTMTFPINAVDDNLADGTQRVNITGRATLAGAVRTATASINVEDYETLSLTINPTTVLENAGNGAVQVTIELSNTDTFPPNTFTVSNNRLREYDYLGTLVRTRTIPWPAGVRPAGQRARDVVVLEDNRVAVYNGTSQVWLSVLSQSTNTWQHIPVPGLSTESTVLAAGGISSTGNFVFLTDTKESATETNGIVRVDVNSGAITRFGTQSPGYRMFVKNSDSIADIIQEIDYQTGAVLNSFPMPVANSFSFETGMAFDGSSLWVLAGPLGNNFIYRLNADTGAVLETHTLGADRGWDGLAYLNGRLYVLDRFIDNEITVYDPIQRRVVNTLAVGTLNNINISGGLAAITGPDRLYVTSTFGSIMYEINPSTGLVMNEWSHGLSSAEGVATANNEIYVGQFIGRNLRVFDRQGLFQRSVALTSNGLHALGGDNVLTLVDTSFRYRDVYTGLDGMIYATDLNGRTVARFSSVTLATDGFITLAASVNALAADSDGSLWGVSSAGVLYRFDKDGAILSQRSIASASLIDIDLDISGQLLLTTATGRVYRTTTSGGTLSSFDVETAVTFATFGRHQTVPTGDVVVRLTNSDPTAIRLPSSVIIPIGQRSVTVLADVIDDHRIDGTQVSTITASALGYMGTQTGTVRVLDAEFVGVDILAASISESAGRNATTARVYRTDVDGPFDFVSRQAFTNSTPKTILDLDKTTSTIRVPVQASILTDVNVTLSLTHGFLADLDIFLISPRGTRVELVTDLISNEKLMTDTVFDDEANFEILTGAAPFTGVFRPEGRLQDFDGERPVGVWTLEITDDNRGHFGTLFSWSLNIETLGLSAMDVALTRTGDANELDVQSFVRIPANQSQIFIPVHAVDDNLLDGTRVSGLRASTTAPGYRSRGDSVNVTDDETLEFIVSQTSVSEAAGPGALIGTLTRRNSNIGAPFTVNLFSSDTTELTVPSSVTFAANQRTVTFRIDAVDDNILDGTQRVTIRASAPAYGRDKLQVVSVEDLEPSLLVSSSETSVREDAGSFIVTVTRQDQSNIRTSMTVNLSVVNVSSGAPPLTVPATVIIPANRISQTFTVTVNDDALLDGTQRATILASSPGIISGSTRFSVTDHETLTVTVNKPSIREDNGANAAVGTVRRSNTNVSQPLVVTLSSSDLTELRVPATVTIPAGARSVQFNIAAVNDPALDGTQTVLISAAARGYFSGSVTVDVLDHEPPVMTAPAATVTNPLPQVKWIAVPNALRYDVLLRNLSTGIEQLYPDIVGTTFTPSEQLGIGRYSASVRAIDQLERDGFWSLARNFKVETAPTVTSPNPKVTQVSGTFPELAWTAIKDAAGYHLTVNNLTTGKLGVISEKDLKTTSFRSLAPLGSGVYTVAVRAFNARKEFGQWSRTVQFTVLAAPSITSPVTGGTFDRTPTITWSRVSGAVSYDVQLINVATQRVVYRDRYVTNLLFQVPQDLPNGEYRTEVRAQNGVYTSQWSTPRLFSVGIAPTITSPESSKTVSGRPKFVWTGITGTDRYEIWIQNVDTKVYVIRNSQVTTPFFTPSANLPLGKYQTTVRAISVLGEVTAWSQPVIFIAGNTPVITAPVNNVVTTSKPTISWTPVSGASAYIVQIFNLTTNKVALTTAKITGTEYTVTSPLPAGRYRVWVRAVSSAGYLSNWGAPVEFSVSTVNRDINVPASDGSGLLASALTEVIETPGTMVRPAMTASTASGNVVQTVVMATSTAPAADSETPDQVADADEMAAMFDAVMSGWDASDWWNVSV